MKEYKYKINGTRFNVSVGDVVDNKVHVEVNGTAYDVELDKAPANVNKVSPLVKPKAPAAAPRTETGQKVVAKPAAPSGTVKKILVGVGDAILEGTDIMIIE